MKTKAPYFVLVLFMGLMFYAGCGRGSSTTSPTPTPTPTPSSICSNPSPGTAPAGSELFYLGDNAGCIHGFGLDPASGNLTPIAINSTSVKANVGLAADSGGQVLYSTDAALGSNVSSWIVNRHTGALTANPAVQLPAPPAKPVAFSTYLYAVVDPNAVAQGTQPPASMWVFKINPLDGSLSLLSDHTTQLPGVPFGLAMDPTGSFLFVLWDGVPGGKISALSRDAATGGVTVIPTPADTGGLAPFAVAVTPDGKFVVVAHQRSNNLAVFALNHATGALTAVPGSPFPTTGPKSGAMTIDPSGKFVLVADAGNNNLTPYALDDSTGSLTAGTPVFLGEANSQPSAITVDPAGKFVFVGIFNQRVAGFTLDPSTGSLAPMSGSPFSGSPQFVTNDMVFEPGVTQ